MPLTDYPNLNGEIANKIVMDVAQDVPPSKSTRVKYGKEELAFRNDVVEDVTKQGIKILDVRE